VGSTPTVRTKHKENRMNELSWLIYLADVAGSLDALFSTLALICCSAGIILTILAIVAKADKEEAIDKTLSFYGRFALGTFFLMAIGAAVIPQRETVYAIAASEVGEQALTSPIATKSFKAIEVWLDKQIAPKVEDVKTAE